MLRRNTPKRHRKELEPAVDGLRTVVRAAPIQLRPCGYAADRSRRLPPSLAVPEITGLPGFAHVRSAPDPGISGWRSVLSESGEQGLSAVANQQPLADLLQAVHVSNPFQPHGWRLDCISSREGVQTLIEDQQVRLLTKEIRRKRPLATAAAKAGMSERTARKWRDSGQLPSESRAAHDWRTREDPFAALWPEVEALLAADPGLQAKAVSRVAGPASRMRRGWARGSALRPEC